jgi:predicted ATPase
LVGERGTYKLAKAIDAIQVPATVQAVLAARIDRLPPEEKRLLQSAAVIGKDLPFVLLEAVSDEAEDELRQSLTRLQAAEFLYETSLFPDLEYTFKHALTHEVAYGGVLQERRRLLHSRIVDTIERLYPDRLAEQIERLAHHASRGELWEKAAAYLHQAGKKSVARSAYPEAMAYFRQALDALEHLPQSRKKLEQALNIRVDLGPVLIAIGAYSSPQVEENYTEARELCQQLGETPQLFPVLWGLARVYDHRGQLDMGRELGHQMLKLAEGVKETALQLEAHHELWANLFSLGEFNSALTHTERGIELYNPQQHRQHAFLYGGHDPGVCGLRHAAMTLWLLGYPEQALNRSEKALALARELSHPYSMAHALFWAGWVYQQCGDRRAVEERIEAAVTLATEQGLTRWITQGAVLQGWLLSQSGKGQEGILKMRQGTLGRGDQPYHAALLAEVYGKEGQIQEAFEVMSEELARVDKSGEHFYDAELYRIESELFLQQTVADEEKAETGFQRALKVARSQQAKSLELRAAMSLSRLWQQQGKRAEAHQLLAEIYRWFTEGFDTADLKQAKVLLEELAQGT